MLRTFDLPKDKIIWDVGHQSYTHKILSGRMQEFDELRQYGGLSGFPKRKESPYDAFDTGHSSTSISAGLGIAQGRDILGEDYKVVSVIGDGALTGGMAYEALNNAARMKTVSYTHLASSQSEENTILSQQSGSTCTSPLIQKELYPEISGIVISAKGGDSPTVQAEISQAMEALFGLEPHKIKVLKRVE